MRIEQAVARSGGSRLRPGERAGFVDGEKKGGRSQKNSNIFFSFSNVCSAEVWNVPALEQLMDERHP